MRYFGDMARPLRIEYPGAWYHVMNRGLNRRLIYSDQEDYSSFLETLGEACSLFNVGAGAYCLMPNHYHVLIHTPEGNLSRFMRHLNGVYTQRYNKKHKRDGPLFRGRFKGILVQEDSYLLQVVKYIHRNPVKAGLTDSLKGFVWSSHKYFVAWQSKTIPEWLEADYILGHFSERRAQAASGYKEFMRQDLTDAASNFYSKKYQGPILGEKSFVARVKEKYIALDRKLDLDVKGERVIRGIAKVRSINKEVCGRYKISEKNLCESRRGAANIPRQMAMLLSRELSGLTHAELAKAYNARTSKAVATSVYRFQRGLTTDKKLAGQHRQLKVLCSQERT